MSAEEIKTGFIKNLHKDKGYGFIKNKESKETIFFHASGCVCPKFIELENEMEVNYIETEGNNGRPKAIEVVAI